MNRRSFLRFLGLGALAAPVAAKTMLEIKPKPNLPPMTMTEAVSHVKDAERYLGWDIGATPPRMVLSGTMTIDKDLFKAWQRRELEQLTLPAETRYPFGREF